jgi:putative transposase
VVKNAQRNEVVTHLIEHHNLSERSACRLAYLGRSSFRYVATQTDDSAHRYRLKELAAKQSAYGYLILHSLLKTEGLVINKKRTYRLYTEEGLQVRTKKRK